MAMTAVALMAAVMTVAVVMVNVTAAVVVMATVKAAARQWRQRWRDKVNNGNSHGRGGEIIQSTKKGTTERAMATETAHQLSVKESGACQV
jgi:hypothetical protein